MNWVLEGMKELLLILLVVIMALSYVRECPFLKRELEPMNPL